MTNIILGFIVFMTTTILARVMYNRAIKQLSAQKKSELVDAMSKQTTWSLAIMLGIIVLFFWSTTQQGTDQRSAMAWFLGSMVVFMVTSIYISRTKMVRLGMTRGFIKTCMMSSTVRLMGLLVFVYFMAESMLLQMAAESP